MIVVPVKRFVFMVSDHLRKENEKKRIQEESSITEEIKILKERYEM